MRGRLFLEQECEHGWLEPHWFDQYSGRPGIDTHCPGGSRRETTLADLLRESGAFEAGTFTGRSIPVPKPGSYLVIDLDALEEGLEDATTEA